MWERIHSCPNEGSLTTSDPWNFGGLKPLEKAPKPTRGGLVPTWNSRDRHSRDWHSRDRHSHCSHGGRGGAPENDPKMRNSGRLPKENPDFGINRCPRESPGKNSRGSSPGQDPQRVRCPKLGIFPLKSWECPSGSVANRSQPLPKGFSIPKLGF